jgi:hypothetical protein
MPQLNRPLTAGESFVLGLVQEHYGEWNRQEEVFLTEREEAVIFVRDNTGEVCIIVNLTVCAELYTRGELSLETLKSDWLRIPPRGVE